jgi:hypothetical protein
MRVSLHVSVWRGLSVTSQHLGLSAIDGIFDSMALRDIFQLVARILVESLSIAGIISLISGPPSPMN